MIDQKIFKINTVSLEGPDLSGKTTLYDKIHKATFFKWDIRDRSALSRICFSRQFGRNVGIERKRLNEELSNMNNRMIVILPDFSVLKDRYISRGDKIQTLDTLRDLHSIYEEEVTKIQNLPNVLVLKDPEKDLLSLSIDFLEGTESMLCSSAGIMVRDFVKNHDLDEHRIQLRLAGSLSSVEDDTILLDPLEGDYYKEILWDMENVIRKETRGLNPYSAKQDMSSRRFYYSSSSCISSIHLLPRGDHVSCFSTFRSTNADKNARIDIEFLNFLVQRLSKKYFFNCKTYSIDLKLNSAHWIHES